MFRTALSTLRPASQLAARAAVPALAPAGARHLHSTRAALSGLTNLFDANPDNPPLSVAKLNERGFHLSDGLVVPGGVILADGAAFLWNVSPPGDVMRGMAAAWAGWTPERFAVFERIVPRPGESHRTPFLPRSGRPLARSPLSAHRAAGGHAGGHAERSARRDAAGVPFRCAHS